MPPVTAFAYAACTLIWGSTWMAIKIGLDGVPPFLGASLRFVLASAVLWAMVALSGRAATLSPRGLKAAGAASLLGFFANYALVYWAETRVPSGLVAVAFALSPILTALFAAALGQERLSARHALGAAIGACGVALLAWPAEGAAAADPAGLLAALLACAGSAFNLVLQSRWAKGEDSWTLNAWAMSAGAVLLYLLSLATEGATPPSWTPKAAGALIYLALAGSVAAFLLLYRLLRELPPSRVSLMTLLFPVVALLLGRVALGEIITARAALGCALILGGTGWALRVRPSGR
jgi:drug/metabolite transporter (DMT)-like permease